MNLDAYHLALAGTGQSKLRALSLLAEGTPASKLEAAVLLHEVARAEQRAVRALDRVSDEVQLASAIERCGSLLEGLDPRAGGKVYGEVMVARKNVPPSQSAAMTVRIDAKFKAVNAQYARVLRELPTIQHQSGAIGWARVPKEGELAVLLRAFPGLASIWFWRSTLARRPADAWAFARNAAKLEPEENTYTAASLRLAGSALSREALAEFLDATHARLASTPASGDVWLFYALAEIDRASHRASQRKVSLERALNACIEGGSRPPSRASVGPGLHLTLHAVRLAVQEMLAGREPSEHVLFEAGLGELVVASSPELRRDPLKLLRASLATAMASAA